MIAQVNPKKEVSFAVKRADGSDSVQRFEVRRINAGDLAHEGVGLAYGRCMDAIAGGMLIAQTQAGDFYGAAFAAVGSFVTVLGRVARNLDALAGGKDALRVDELEPGAGLALLIDAFVELHAPADDPGKVEALAPLVNAVTGRGIARMERTLALLQARAKEEEAARASAQTNGQSASGSSSTSASVGATPPPMPESSILLPGSAASSGSSGPDADGSAPPSLQT